MLTGLTLTESDRRARQVAPAAHLSLIEIRSEVFRFAAGSEAAGLWVVRLVSPVCGEKGLLNKGYLWTKGGMEESLLKERSSSFNCWYARSTSCQEEETKWRNAKQSQPPAARWLIDWDLAHFWANRTPPGLFRFNSHLRSLWLSVCRAPSYESD